MQGLGLELELELGTGRLTACGCEDYEAGPVVFDQFAHAAAQSPTEGRLLAAWAIRGSWSLALL